MSDLQTTAKEILIALIERADSVTLEERPETLVGIAAEMAELLLNETE